AGETTLSPVVLSPDAPKGASEARVAAASLAIGDALRRVAPGGEIVPRKDVAAASGVTSGAVVKAALGRLQAAGVLAVLERKERRGKATCNVQYLRLTVADGASAEDPDFAPDSPPFRGESGRKSGVESPTRESRRGGGRTPPPG